MPRESRRDRSSDRYRPSRRSPSPRRRRSRSPSRHSSRYKSLRHDSRSPPRHRPYERHRRDEPPTRHRRNKSPSRSRSPIEQRARSRSRTRSPQRNTEKPKANGVNMEEMSEEDQMKALMGFSGFDTTKNRRVAGNASGAANVKKPRKYRQYMNRKGGFNRLLDKQ